MRSYIIFVLSLLALAAAKHSITGFSSGAFMAVQYQFAHSKDVSGAAIFAGGPFYCAQDQLTDAFEDCMEAVGPIDLDTLNAQIKSYTQGKLIDDPINLAKQNVYLFSGQLDYTVRPSVVQALQQQYQFFNVQNVETEYTVLAAHGFPTVNYGVLCELQESPFVNDCNYDGAGTALQTIYGTLKPQGTMNPNSFYTIPQGSFTPNKVDPSTLSMDTNAYAYVPAACNSTKANCPVHIVLHGCQQSVSVVGNVFVQNSGYNGWAESNGIIVLYPQTIVSYFSPMNPEGCWDWWGYLSADYSTKNAPQIQTIYNMAMKLSQFSSN